MNWFTVKITIYLTGFKVEHSCVKVDLRVTFFNDLLSKIDIKFVPSKSIEFSGKYFEYWD